MNTKIKPQKVGTIITVLLFGLICAIGGYEIHSSTDGASSPLPVSKGGTGGNNFPANSVLVGNGPLSFSSRGIDTTPQSGSNNLITSDALYKGPPTENIPLTMQSNWALSYSSSVKIGKLCSLTFRTYNNTVTINAGTNYLIADVDTKCRPAQRVHSPLVLTAATNSSHDNIFLMITTAGSVYIYNYGTNSVSAGTGSMFGVSVTYLANS
ncbi:MAG: hypothetical protein LBB10_00525 [Bifidobacteriaceae bacterium]|jgi:hypothetical protein|nr:hypothetical protein [Bifidobacteriaceae bacterium]